MTQPGRRGRSLRLVMVRGWTSLALRPASFLTRRLSPDRASCAAKVARSSATILSIEPESWFEYPPLARTKMFGLQPSLQSEAPVVAPTRTEHRHAAAARLGE